MTLSALRLAHFKAFRGSQRIPLRPITLVLRSNRAREPGRAGGVRLERFALLVDAAPLLSMTARPGGLLRLDRLDHRHPVFREVFRGIVTLATTTPDLREEDFEGLGEVLDALIPGI